MFKFIANVVLLILAVAMFIGLGVEEVEERYRNTYKFKFKKKCLIGLVPIGVMVATSCVVIVPSNTVGIRYSAINGTSETTLGEGIAFKSPIDKIYHIETTVQERTIDNVTVQTKDAQFVSMQVNVKFRVDQKDAFKVYKGYKTLDSLSENIIGNYAQKSIESVVTQYNVIEVLGEKKNEIYDLSTKALSEKLSNEGVQLVDIIIKDMDAGEAIEKAIADEAVAKKAVETAEQNRLKAEKDAETKVIQAQGEADANEILAEKLTDEVLLDKWISKWNGVLPTVSGENNVMIDINKLLEKGEK